MELMLHDTSHIHTHTRHKRGGGKKPEMLSLKMSRQRREISLKTSRMDIPRTK